MKIHTYTLVHKNREGKTVTTRWLVTARSQHAFRLAETAFVTTFWKDGVRILGGPGYSLGESALPEKVPHAFPAARVEMLCSSVSDD